MPATVAPDMKAMRKGTRSCRECRRRKIKCNWSSPTASKCTECLKGSRHCFSQGYVRTNGVGKPGSVINVRVNRIESIVERLAEQQQAQAANGGTSNGDQSHRVETHLRDLDLLDQQARTQSPLYALFNNEVISQPKQSKPSQPNTASIISFGDGNLTSLEKLQSTIAQEPEILDILDVSQDWWVSWRDQAWVLRTSGISRSARGFVEGQLKSTDPVIYATGLLCIAMALQHLRSGHDEMELQLSTGPATLVERMTTAVDQIILTNYTKHEMAILVALQRAKIHAEDNQLRKSWLKIRQAILMMKELGYGTDSDVAKEEMATRQRWVGGVYEMDHFMSMILGFPQAADDNFTDKLALDVLMRSLGDDDLQMRALRRVVALSAARINDRNAKQQDDDSHATTQSIHKVLSNAANCMPPAWWDLNHHLQSADPQAAFEHLMTHLWFWQIQAFLHLPYMLRRNESSTYHQNHELCLTGCRNMLRVFCSLRHLPAFSVYICSCDDFQGVLSACMLLTGVLVRLSADHPVDLPYLDDDFDTIQFVKETFKYRSQQQNSSIARQGLKAITTLESFLTNEPTDAQQQRRAGIILPYFGLIDVEAKVQLKASGLTSSNGHESSSGLSFDGEQQSLGQYPDTVDSLHELHPSDFNKVDSLQWPELEQNMRWDSFLLGDELAQDWGLYDVDEIGLSSPLDAMN